MLAKSMNSQNHPHCVNLYGIITNELRVGCQTLNTHVFTMCNVKVNKEGGLGHKFCLILSALLESMLFPTLKRYI